MDLLQKIEEAAAYIKKSVTETPEVGIILGTGLGRLVESIDIKAEAAYGEIPHFVSSTVEHHAGKLIFGLIGGKPVLCMQGRFHFYEGYSLEQITFPVRVMKKLGIESLLISNVAGGLNREFKLGTMMLLKDHINLLGASPLTGKNYEELGPRWPDMIEPYSEKLSMLAKEAAEKEGLALDEGIYAFMGGPQLETRAEYRMLQIIGADAVGMSTVPEVICAVHSGIPVMAVSIITDLCFPETLAPVDIEKIIAVANRAEPGLVTLVKGVIERL